MVHPVNWPPVILVAEDNDDEFVLLRCAFKSAGLPHRLIGVAHGGEALEYLHAEEGYSNRARFPFPDLMLLDLYMPVMDGLEVLAAVSNRFEFLSLPIVVLSADDDPMTILTARRLGAKEYIVKPLTMSERVEMVRRLHARWLAGSKKPPEHGWSNIWSVRSPREEPKLE